MAVKKKVAKVTTTIRIAAATLKRWKVRAAKADLSLSRWIALRVDGR